MNEGVPQKPELSEEQINKNKWIGAKLIEDPSVSIEELSAEYDEKRAAILATGGFEEKEFTQMAGTEGAGTIETGHRSSLPTDKE